METPPKNPASIKTIVVASKRSKDCWVADVFEFLEDQRKRKWKNLARVFGGMKPNQGQ
jgi:hypothetical protein